MKTRVEADSPRLEKRLTYDASGPAYASLGFHTSTDGFIGATIFCGYIMTSQNGIPPVKP